MNSPMNPLGLWLQRGGGLVLLAAPLALGLGAGCSTPAGHSALQAGLRDALVFHASFDRGTDADFGRGDRRIYHATGAPKLAREPVAGLPSGGAVERVAEAGVQGGAMRWNRKSAETVFYRGENNLTYRASEWSGTYSLWLKVDPAGQLAPGYCDPLQITPRDWNDASFFVEFEKKPDLIPFRLGAYADYKVWNPADRKWEAIPFEEKPLCSVLRPPFRADAWTHVVVTFDRYNTGREDGVTRLYLNGELAALISPREQTYTWDLAATRIQIGLSYIGLLDDLALFSRALSAQEVRALHGLNGGVRALY